MIFIGNLIFKNMREKWAFYFFDLEVPALVSGDVLKYR